MVKSRIPLRCRMGQHSETYLDTLIVTNMEIRRCKVCQQITDAMHAEVWAFEEQALQDLRDVSPISERYRQVRRLVKGMLQARNYPIPDGM